MKTKLFSLLGLILMTSVSLASSLTCPQKAQRIECQQFEFLPMTDSLWCGCYKTYLENSCCARPDTSEDICQEAVLREIMQDFGADAVCTQSQEKKDFQTCKAQVEHYLTSC